MCRMYVSTCVQEYIYMSLCEHECARVSGCVCVCVCVCVGAVISVREVYLIRFMTHTHTHLYVQIHKVSIVITQSSSPIRSDTDPRVLLLY